jgi:hypothetical protein
MSLDEAFAEAIARIHWRIEARYQQMQRDCKFAAEHARRSLGQKFRHVKQREGTK